MHDNGQFENGRKLATNCNQKENHWNYTVYSITKCDSSKTDHDHLQKLIIDSNKIKSLGFQRKLDCMIRALLCLHLTMHEKLNYRSLSKVRIMRKVCHEVDLKQFLGTDSTALEVHVDVQGTACQILEVKMLLDHACSVGSTSWQGILDSRLSWWVPWVGSSIHILSIGKTLNGSVWLLWIEKDLIRNCESFSLLCSSPSLRIM